MDSYRSAITRFARRHGPVGDTKYDIFDQSGMSRAQMRRARTHRRPKVKTYRNYKPTSGSAPGETV